MVDATSCECCGTDRSNVDAAPADPPVSVEDAMATPVPEDVGTAMAVAYDLDAPPETVEAWLDGVLAAHESADGTPEPADMCSVEDARHAVELDGDRPIPGTDGDESTAYVCVLDPLAIPFLAGTAGTIRSESPIADRTFEFRVGPDEVTVDPESTVVSLGVDAPDDAVDAASTDAANAPDDADGAADTGRDAPLTVDDTYEMVCPYGHAFRDADAYERWAAERDDVATMAFDAETAVGVAVGIARRLDAAR